MKANATTSWVSADLREIIQLHPWAAAIGRVAGLMPASSSHCFNGVMAACTFGLNRPMRSRTPIKWARPKTLVKKLPLCVCVGYALVARLPVGLRVHRAV